MPQLADTSLAQSTAHELNNIAASLCGFVELAAEQLAGDSPLARCLDEIKIGASRVTNLASVLEALAEVPGDAARIALGICVGGGVRLESGGGFRFEWNCDPATPVTADGDRVKLAVRTLAHLGRSEWTPNSEVAFTVGGMPSPENCHLCGAGIAAGGARITLVADDVRLFDADRAARRRAGRTFRELIFCGAAHAAHMAGGHVAVNAAESCISILLPAA